MDGASQDEILRFAQDDVAQFSTRAVVHSHFIGSRALPASHEPLEELEGSNDRVILSEAKDHLATLDPLKMILRFAQDDSLVHSSPMTAFIVGLGTTLPVDQTPRV